MVELVTLGSVLRTTIDAEPNTNFMTDAEKTKLTSVETGAQVNEALASKSEAEAGTDNVKTMTSLRVRDALAVTLINTQTDDYTLVLADAGKYVRMNKATAVNLTVPLNSSVAFPIGTIINIRNTGAGQVTVVATGGVTINTIETLKLRAQHATASLIKVDTDTWDLMGDLEVAP